MEVLGIEEGTARLSVFLGLMVSMMLLELIIPKRKLRWSKLHRWVTNLLYTGLNTFVIRLMAWFVVPLAAVTTAVYASSQGYGLLNIVEWPFWVEFLIALILLDMAIYFQHWASHKIPMLWHFHRVHHSDVDIDVTTAIRFHPVEIALSMLYKIILVFILGPAAVAVLVFEMILNGCAMFNHANISLPRWLDSIIRVVLVTPDMHRIHHSIIERETNSNYGFSISLWDRLYGTYNAQPVEGHDGMTIGLPQYQSTKPTNWFWTLTLPFKGDKADHAPEPPTNGDDKTEKVAAE